MGFHIVCLLVIFVVNGIQATDKHQKNYRTSNLKFASALPCPDPDVIFPCVCHCNTEFKMSMSCSNVTSEDQLKQIFNSDLPYTDFSSLYIASNKYLKSLRAGDLGLATFETITIFHGSLETVDPNSLTGSASRLTSLNLSYNNVSSFPYEEIPLFTKLDTLWLEGNPLSQYRTIISSTIRQLYLSATNIAALPSNAVHYLPNIKSFSFDYNPVTEIHPGTFNRSNKLNLLQLKHCQLSYIPAETIILSGANSRLELSYNFISNVEIHAITGDTDVIYFDGNELTELKEEVWRPVMDNVQYISFMFNQLLCGCDIAWLILTPTYLQKVEGRTSCSSGELLTDLDPAMFEQFC